MQKIISTQLRAVQPNYQLVVSRNPIVACIGSKQTMNTKIKKKNRSGNKLLSLIPDKVAIISVN